MQGSYIGDVQVGHTITGSFIVDDDSANAGPGSDPNPSNVPGHEYTAFWDFPLQVKLSITELSFSLLEIPMIMLSSFISQQAANKSFQQDKKQLVFAHSSLILTRYLIASESGVMHELVISCSNSIKEVSKKN